MFFSSLLFDFNNLILKNLKKIHLPIPPHESTKVYYIIAKFIILHKTKWKKKEEKKFINNFNNLIFKKYIHLLITGIFDYSLN